MNSAYNLSEAHNCYKIKKKLPNKKSLLACVNILNK